MPVDPSLSSRWIITFATLAYGVGPFIVDMNRTHLFHPQWSGHARFHLLWSATSQLAVAGLALWLIWGEGNSASRCRLASIIGLCMTSGFWIAFILRKAFGGTLHDVGGIAPIGGKIDGNLVAVFLIDALLIVGFLKI